MIRGLTSCPKICSNYKVVDAAKQVSNKTVAIVSNGARTAISMSCINYARLPHASGLFKSISPLETSIGFSILSPFTKLMTVVSMVDTLFENYNKRDLSWTTALCRKMPGFLTASVLSHYLALATPEALGFYVAYRIIDASARAIIAFGQEDAEQLPERTPLYYYQPQYLSDDEDEKSDIQPIGREFAPIELPAHGAETAAKPADKVIEGAIQQKPDSSKKAKDKGAQETTSPEQGKIKKKK